MLAPPESASSSAATSHHNQHFWTSGIAGTMQSWSHAGLKQARTEANTASEYIAALATSAACGPSRGG